MAAWLNHFRLKAPPSPFRLRRRIFLPPSSPYRLSTRIQSRAGLPGCVPSSLLSGGSGILTGCPSPTPLGLGLGPTNPTRINLPSETLGLRRTCFSHVSRYSYRHSHFCPLHQSSRSGFTAGQNAPLPRPNLSPTSRSFGARLEPRYIVGAESLDQ